MDELDGLRGRIARLATSVHDEFRSGMLAACLKVATGRPADAIEGLYPLIMRLCDMLSQWSGHPSLRKRPSDNLHYYLSRLSNGDPTTKEPIIGLGIIPKERAKLLDIAREFSNKAHHADGITIGFEEAQAALGGFLAILRWAYCEFASGPRLKSIYNDEEAVVSLERLASLALSSPPVAGSMDVAGHLRALRREVQILRENGCEEQAIGRVTEEIKDVCIVSELYFTQAIAEAGGAREFLYACSSLLDTGYQTYLEDGGWLRLLRRMGRSARMSGLPFVRVFFVEVRPLTAVELYSLSEVIRLHLREGVRVALVEDSDVPLAARTKRNMACLGGVVLQATDQIQWDLDLTARPIETRAARDRHHLYLDLALALFEPQQAATVDVRLRELFPTVDRSPDQRNPHDLQVD